MKEEVLQKLESVYEAKDIIQINDLMGYQTAEELRELTDVLEELVSEYIVYKTKKDKYILLKNCVNLKIGKFEGNKKGFGFVVPDDAVFVLLFIVGGMILCGIGYWNQCRSDRLTPWILILTALGILEIFQLPAKEMSALDLILCVGVTLAGLGIQNCLSGAKAPDEEEKKDEKTASEEKAGLRFIENPLPLPKKHVKKTMDYAFEPDEAMMKYDVEVADGDDYDI